MPRGLLGRPEIEADERSIFERLEAADADALREATQVVAFAILYEVRGSNVELGEQIAIGLRSANLRQRGYDQFWTHSQWKGIAGT